MKKKYFKKEGMEKFADRSSKLRTENWPSDLVAWRWTWEAVSIMSEGEDENIIGAGSRRNRREIGYRSNMGLFFWSSLHWRGTERIVGWRCEDKRKYPFFKIWEK